MINKICVCLFLCLNLFLIHSQIHQKTKCSISSITFFENSGNINKLNNLFCYDCDSCNLQIGVYHQVAWQSDNGELYYSNSFPNVWYENGKIHRELLRLSDSLIVYNHYDEMSNLIGQEFFSHKISSLEFFLFTGEWWWIKNGKKVFRKLPTFYIDNEFDY